VTVRVGIYFFAGLGVFMSYIEEFKDRNIKMVLYGMNDRVANTFSILGLNELLQIGKDKVQAKKIVNEL
jgi:anti-sigma B factor antagonist